MRAGHVSAHMSICRIVITVVNRKEGRRGEVRPGNKYNDNDSMKIRKWSCTKKKCWKRSKAEDLFFINLSLFAGLFFFYFFIRCPRVNSPFTSACCQLADPKRLFNSASSYYSHGPAVGSLVMATKLVTHTHTHTSEQCHRLGYLSCYYYVSIYIYAWL